MPADWDELNLQQLIGAAQHAITRSRFVFLAINVAGILLLAEVYNTHLLWIRNTVNRPDQKRKEFRDNYTNIHGQQSVTNEEYLTELRDLTNSFPDAAALEALKKVEQTDLWVVSMPIIGVKFSDWDLPILGAVGMVVLTLWYVLAVRREFLVIKVLREEARREPDNIERRRYLYNSVSNYFVWLQVENIFSPPNAKRTEFTWFYNVLQFMPAWGTWLATLADVTTLIFPTNASHGSGTSNLWSTMFFNERIEIIMRYGLSVLIGWYCWHLCRQALNYQKRTMFALHHIKNDEIAGPGLIGNAEVPVEIEAREFID